MKSSLAQNPFEECLPQNEHNWAAFQPVGSSRQIDVDNGMMMIGKGQQMAMSHGGQYGYLLAKRRMLHSQLNNMPNKVQKVQAKSPELILLEGIHQ